MISVMRFMAIIVSGAICFQVRQHNIPKFEYLTMHQMAKIPLKIAVAGCGIGGTYAGIALAKKGFDVTLFEKSAKFSRFGGPIQLASNALSCVNALSPELFAQMMGRFTFTGETE
jgi:heterodisulfide reductase subunit A-like polyferredoxin